MITPQEARKQISEFRTKEELRRHADRERWFAANEHTIDNYLAKGEWKIMIKDLTIYNHFQLDDALIILKQKYGPLGWEITHEYSLFSQEQSMNFILFQA